MSFQEKRSLVALVSSIVITVFYCAYMFSRHPVGDAYSPEVFRFWGNFFLVLVPVTIVANIVIHIVFSILNTIATREEEPTLSDERDEWVDLKATRFALYVFGFGFLLAMVSLVLEQPPSVMFALLLCGGVASEVVAEALRFYFYRRGF
jgi:uncharacterized membrane protein